MSQRLSMIALLGTVSLTAGCGADNSAAGIGGASATTSAGGASGTAGAGGTGGAAGAGGTGDAGMPSEAGMPAVSHSCTSGENALCVPSGFPFAIVTFPNSDWCAGEACLTAPPMGATTIRLSQPETGTLCLSGTGQGGAGVILRFTGSTSEGALIFFNADALGITQLRFTIDRPPPGGVLVWAATIHSAVCHMNLDCLTFGFELPNRITQSGTSTASLIDFARDSGPIFDTRALDAIGFSAGSGDYDFCVRDFQFLDANGVEVRPPQL